VSNDIWSLFADWEETPDPFAYTLEIVDAALSGRIALENFNLSAYNQTIRKNEVMMSNRRKSKILYIVDDSENSLAEPYCIPETVVSPFAGQEDAYEKFEDEEEVSYAVREIRDLRGVIISGYRLDVLYCIKQALKGIPESVKALKNLVNSDPFIGELIRVVLESGQPFAELFPEAV